MRTTSPARIVITGAAGLVGQNLIPRLRAAQLGEIVAIDKHSHNAGVLRQLNPGLRVVVADLAQPGEWQDELCGCTHLVISHAQIGGSSPDEYVRNNITATENVIRCALDNHVGYVVGISSSVVNSAAIDDYTETKKAQERLIASSGLGHIILRPTLMFGWCDRKHLGWLAHFMKKFPVFPIPGNGKYLRQPLYAGDFCDIIVAALQRKTTGAYNITGQERVDYIDLIRLIKEVTGAKTTILRIPYRLFWLLLAANSLFDKNPAFTTSQLQALVTPDVFEVIDWPGIFGVRSTPLREALTTTFCDPAYSNIPMMF